jgi:hypothetical protein
VKAHSSRISRQQFEHRHVAGTDDAEVAAVEGRYFGTGETFGGRYDRGVDGTEG